MTDQQILLVRGSWGVIQKQGAEVFANLLYKNLFVAAPQVEHLFRIPPGGLTKKLFATIELIVSQLCDLESITIPIEQLARQHCDYGVRQEHYDYFGWSLLRTMKDLLGNLWSEELAAAWQRCYAILAEKMITAACKYLATQLE